MRQLRQYIQWKLQEIKNEVKNDSPSSSRLDLLVWELRIVNWYDDYLASLHWRWTIFAREDAEADDSIMAKIYPRSKEHLEQIILAFKP